MTAPIFHEALKAIRTTKGETATAWGKLIDLSPSGYGDVEAGRRSPLTREEMGRLPLNPREAMCLRELAIKAGAAVEFKADSALRVATLARLEAEWAAMDDARLARLLALLFGQPEQPPAPVPVAVTVRVVHRRKSAKDKHRPKKAAAPPQATEPPAFPLGRVPTIPPNPGDNQVYNRRGPLVVHGIDWSKAPDEGCIEQPMQPTSWSWAITRHNECTIHPDRIDELLTPEMWDAHPWHGWRASALRKLLVRWCVLQNRRLSLSLTDDPADRLASGSLGFEGSKAALWARVLAFPTDKPEGNNGR